MHITSNLFNKGEDEMFIKIDDKYSITSDARQYILQEGKEVLEGENKGQVYYNPIGYYGTITAALKGYKELKIRSSNVTTINELMQLIEDLDNKIETLLKGN